MLDILQVEHLGPGQSQGSAGGSHYNVWTAGLDGLFVLLDRDTAKEHAHFDGWHVLGEALILFGDLEG